MLNCPRCGIPAERRATRDGLIWHCSQCGGASTIISQMRKYVPTDLVNSLWRTAKTTPRHSTTCPSCNKKLVEIPVSGATWMIDICPDCAFVWFDYGEYSRLPKALPKPSEKQLPPEITQLLALRQIEDLRKTAWAAKDAPDEGWKYIPALMGIPVEFDAEEVSLVPYVTWSLLLLIIVTSLFGFLNILPVETFGFIPAHWSRMGGLTSLTSFFLHGSLSHLLGNLYFLFMFGDNVEDVLGHWRFLLLFLISTLVGNLTLMLTAQDSTAFCIGASGGISGILAYYALRFPRYRLGIFFFPRQYFRRSASGWIRFPVTVYLGFWILLQLIGVSCGLTGVAYMAHLGGLLAGAGYWMVERATEARK